MGGLSTELLRPIAVGAAVQLLLLLAWLALPAHQATAGRLRLRPSEQWARLAPWLALAGIGAAWCLDALGLIALPVLARIGAIALGFGCAVALAFRQRALEGRLEHVARAGQRFRTLVEAAPLGIATCDASGRATFANERLWRLLGAPAPLPPADLQDLLREASSGGGAPLRRALESGDAVTSELSYASRWRGTRALHLVAGPLRGSAGEIEGALLLIEDVTEHRAIDHHLRDSQRLEAMARLAALLAHELNDPLACVRTNLAVLRDELPLGRDSAGIPRELPSTRAPEATRQAAELAKILDESLVETERAIAIVGDFQLLAPEASASDDSIGTASLAPLLRNCVRIAGAHARAGIPIAESYAELGPVRGTALQLRQLFLDLLVNAVQAAGERGHVRVSSERQSGDAVVRVSDDGPGIAPEDHARIFEPFFTTRPRGEGTGLGLFMARAIVKAHQGEIRVHSAPGAGATFEVRLPLSGS